MALKRSSPNNIFTNNGNALEIYVDGSTGILMLKDIDGNVAPVSDFVGGTTGNFIKNQLLTKQDANFWIEGKAKIGGDTQGEESLNVLGNFCLNDGNNNIYIHNSSFPPGPDGLGFKNISIGDENLTKDGAFQKENNICIGFNILEQLTNGTSNIAIGNAALANANNVDSLIAIGSGALGLSIDGQINLAIGHVAMLYNESGDRNIAIGYSALGSSTVGDDNIAIGISCENNGFSGSLIIGHGAKSTKHNQIVIGSAIKPIGAITTETLISTHTLEINLNGNLYKLLMRPVI